MRNHRTQGIVIHKRLIGDQDTFVTIITKKFGRLDAMAKGAKKITSKFVGSLDVLNLCEFDLYQGPKTWIIRDAAILESFQAVKTHLEQSQTAHSMITLVYKIVHDTDENAEDFFLLKQALKSLNDIRSATHPHAALKQFSKNLLTAHGLHDIRPNGQKSCDPVQDF